MWNCRQGDLDLSVKIFNLDVAGPKADLEDEMRGKPASAGRKCEYVL